MKNNNSTVATVTQLFKAGLTTPFTNKAEDKKLKALLKRVVNREQAPESLRLSILEMIQK